MRRNSPLVGIFSWFLIISITYVDPYMPRSHIFNIYTGILIYIIIYHIYMNILHREQFSKRPLWLGHKHAV